MSLSTLPAELLEAIAQELPTERHINSLVRVNRRLCQVLNRYLYRRNDTEGKPRSGNALYWAARKGLAETILRAEALGIAVPALPLIARAAKSGQLGIVKLLFGRVRRSGDGAPDLGDPSALVLAVEKGHLEVVRFFVQEGADLEAKGPRGDTVLHEAARQSDLSFAELLLEHGANMEARNDDGDTPIHVACQRVDDDTAVRFFVARGAAVDARDTEMGTPLHQAAQWENADALRALLEGGADPDAQHLDGWTALHTAADAGNIDCLKALIDGGATLSVRENSGWTPLKAALYGSQPDAAQFLIESGSDISTEDTPDTSPLWDALTSRYTGISRLLMERGARLTAPDEVEIDWMVGRSPGRAAQLVWLVLIGSAPRDGPVGRGHVAVARVLTARGADASAPRLLAFAVERGDAEVVRLLLESGSDAGGAVEGGQPPLVMAAISGLVEIGRLLLDYRADVGARAPDGCTALGAATARQHGAFVALLRERGAIV